MRIDHPLLPVTLALLLAACDSAPPPILGSLEWDRVAIHAEAAEPVLAWHVAEGDRVSPGTVLLRLDDRRLRARLDQARAQLAQSQARLTELSNGTRVETIQAARAELGRARAAQQQAEREYLRVHEVRERGLIAAADLDAALAGRDQARAGSAAAEARLRELTAGTRPEQVEQAAAAVDAALAAVAALELDLDRLTITAPRDGRVDALPFKPGDTPPLGAVVASLLVGDAPYARVFVPAPRRLGIEPGRAMRVQVTADSERSYAAVVRSVRSEPSFTPYYALAGDDANRLVYRAELLLRGEGVADLPAGLPVSAEVADDGEH